MSHTEPDALVDLPVDESDSVCGVDLTVGLSAKGEELTYVNFDFHPDALPSRAQLVETFLGLFPEDLNRLRQVGGVIGYVQ